LNASHVDRRTVIGGALACAVLPATRALAAAPSGGTAATGFFERHHLPVGLQLYTVGDAIRKDLDGSLAKIASIGYRVVEPASYHGYTPQQLREAADRHGLKCTSIHIGAKASGGNPGLDQDLPRLAADLHLLGVTDVVMPMFVTPERFGGAKPGEGSGYMGRVSAGLTVDDWKRTAALLNEKGAALRREGLRLGYHNHNPEFAPVAGTTGLEVLLAETSPDAVVFEMDVGWVAAAGVDPVALLRKFGKRFQLMHVKDIQASTKANYALQQDPTEVGSGSMDWARLLPTAFEAGVRKFYVEQEPPFKMDRFDAIDKSRRFLMDFGVDRIKA
jgi:sugar phosphate isomerase/epimerase